MKVLAASFMHMVRLLQTPAARRWHAQGGALVAGVFIGLTACSSGTPAASRTVNATPAAAVVASDPTQELALTADAAAIAAVPASSGRTAPPPQAAKPDRSPAARFSPGLAYDGARHEVVLFGGATFETGLMTYFSDTWTWNGGTWKQVRPAHSPSPRAWPEMAYDEARHQVVLFGGQGPDVPRLRDTWIWDGSDWTQATPSFSPVGTIEEGMAFFPGTGTVLMYSGANLADVGNHLYSWDGSNWTDLQVPGGPPTSSFQGGLSLDPTRGVMVLLAYDVNAAYEPNPALRHWEFDGRAWTRRDVPTPPLRPLVQTVTDTKRGEIVMFGGTGHNDTWTWNGREWEQQSPAHSPAVRSSTGPMPGLAYDGTRHRVVVFGGWQDGVGPLGDTWTWDGRDWKRRA